ncbi:MAG: PBP1A family penicillin-binding protein [Bdellovibrionaceae bacterium]|nr:PBP1A family penicillin-binding protein [Bdellovibrio sp.]
MIKKIVIVFFALVLISVLGLYLAYASVKKTLPDIIKIEDYKPLLVSQVYDRDNKKIGEFFRERRVLIPYKDIPQVVINAFLAAEDDQFFQHKGINPSALFRAALANMRAGRNVQGGSTITQQVAKTLLLSNEKTFTRKLRDILLAIQMEENLTKEEILYLYLNQIYFGQGAYGIEMAAQTYFKKPTKQLTLAEAAMLAGLPKAPSDFSPVKNPSRAKERQRYVLNRMAEVKFIKKEEAKVTVEQPLKVYLREDYEVMAPFYLETVRQLLVKQLGEDVILDQGVKVYTGLDLEMQKAANEAVKKGLKELDKRQGFRGPLASLKSDDEINAYLEKLRTKLISESNPERIILPDGNFAEIEWHATKKNKKEKINTASSSEKLPSFLTVGTSYEGVVTHADDTLGYVEVRLPEATGMIEFDSMTWARKPNFDKKPENDLLKKPSQALKKGDVILVKITSDKFQWAKKRKDQAKLPAVTQHLTLELDQEPVVEGSLLSFDQKSQEVLAMVGGYSFARNEFNRALQAARQTGSAFKAIIYAAALEKNYNPSTPIIDAPIIYKQAGDEEGQGDEKVWKPSNHGREFNGEITMRNALVKSLNIPSVKIMEDIGVPFATEFAQRLGVFSKLNPDFTLVLGSSSLTLYEMTKVFSQFGRMGLRTRPLIVKKVLDRKGQVLLENLNLDARFTEETQKIDEDFEAKRKAFLQNAQESEGTDSHLFFDNPEQLIRPQTAYVITNMLKGVINDPNGTGGQAAQLGRETAGKTGTTNGYVDAWFLGYTPNIATGVWVGFDKEKTIGRGEVGGKSALPIWLDYMKEAHTNQPILSFSMPEGVKLVKIDAESGKLAHSASKRVIEQAFIDGTEPTAAASRSEETTDHLKQDMDE